MILSTVSITFPQTEEIMDLNDAFNCHARGLLLVEMYVCKQLY